MVLCVCERSSNLDLEVVVEHWKGPATEYISNLNVHLLYSIHCKVHLISSVLRLAVFLAHVQVHYNIRATNEIQLM